MPTKPKRPCNYPMCSDRKEKSKSHSKPKLIEFVFGVFVFFIFVYLYASGFYFFGGGDLREIFPFNLIA